MEQSIKYRDEVWSKDDAMLGLAMVVHHRQIGADPDVKIYEAYLEVEDFVLGMSYFIPAEFLLDRDEGSGRVVVDRTLKQVLHNTWTRRPTFVAAGAGEEETLLQE